MFTLKKKFDTLPELVYWLEDNQGNLYRVRNTADDAGWQRANDALNAYREILCNSSEKEMRAYDDTELEYEEFSKYPLDDEYDTQEAAEEADSLFADGAGLVVRKHSDSGKPVFVIYTDEDMFDVFSDYDEEGVRYAWDEACANSCIDFEDLEKLVKEKWAYKLSARMLASR